ncbi:putative nepenthesin [Rosa chinensis]|uniref:Putative nepenthesin n=1 Tax=Rosa chinensis TaxID=74649 RepID=A0A2P6SE55_ROSCH|nr:aspartic proteinase CDR1 [Rosa chinensis]PRQ56960.1 putative nepenthesin [Rosa chinensis]
MAALATTAFALFLLCVSDFISVSAKGGFTVDLIHRDSPRSPFYNPSETPSQRLKNAFHRSFGRLSHLKPTNHYSVAQPNQAESTLISNRGDYLMELSIGTPPFSITAIADTGSDLIWTQCEPCVNCYTQTDPIFDPSKSSTYKTIHCSSNQCTELKGRCPAKGSGSGSACQYEVDYGIQYTIGNLAVDTLTLPSTTGRNVSFPKTIIGCGHNNTGTFDKKETGIVGLGGGDESLITQLGTSIDGKFSYCLVPFAWEGNQTSKLNFGDNAVVSGSGVVSTPIVEYPTQKTFFFLTLKAISVGKVKVPYSSSSSASSKGNIIIDSGTTLTLLEPSFYSKLEKVVDKVVGGERVNDSQIGIPLCYKVSQSKYLKLPNITVHFSGGNVKLKPNNTFIRVSDEALCFAFAPAVLVPSLYGNVAQADFLVGYDVKKKTVSFKPTDCTKV